MELADRIRKVLQLGGDSWAVEFEGATYSWAQIEALADAICAAIRDAGAKEHDVIGGWRKTCLARLPARRASPCTATAAH